MLWFVSAPALSSGANRLCKSADGLKPPSLGSWIPWDNGILHSFLRLFLLVLYSGFLLSKFALRLCGNTGSSCFVSSKAALEVFVAVVGRAELDPIQ